ncbi:magnesium transporter [Mycoplasmopsis columbinasalis]|uniref:Magnesium transporter MgtE n=1 Tax=Mycoplasmopsis columbinasalis TaxID=114880 RepID=A0A449B9M3_9BACT|nr:magnesium transporter [Mycoplasmopsis columbinasalis]VEU77881.1 Magnesium transporter mgtE [Mycoplasmopsis columbinasalis]
MNDQTESQLLERITTCVEQRSVQGARELIDETPNAVIAEVMNELNLEQQLTFLRLLKTADAAELFSYLDDEVQKNLAQSFSEDWGMKLLQSLQSDELADILDELPANVTSKILAYTPLDRRQELNKLLQYGDDQVGSIMSIDISSVFEQYTCEQALNKIRRDYQKKGAELVHYYYVVDSSAKLLGVLTLEEILFADPNAKIADIYSPVTSVTAYDKKEDAAKIFSDHDMSVLPVTNKEKRLIGMITSDDVIDVINEETTHNLHHLAGITKNKYESEYLKTPWYRLTKTRLLWTFVSLLFASLIHILLVVLSNKLTGGLSLQSLFILGLVPTTIILATLFGLQTNSQVSRALSLEEVDVHTDFKKVIGKEVLVGLLLGVFVFVLNFSFLASLHAAFGNFQIFLTQTILALAALSALILFVSAIFATLLGALIPLVLAKKNKDPNAWPVVLITNIVNLLMTAPMFFVLLI